MSTPLSTRIAEASKIVQQYFKTNININLFFQELLKELGIDDSDIGFKTLEIVTFVEFDTAFCNYMAVYVEKFLPPKPRIRLAFEVLKDKKTETTNVTVVNNNASIDELVKTLRPIGQWGDLELLEKYSKDCSIEIEEELQKRSKGRFCIIFNDDGTIDTESSLYMIRRARTQDTPSTFEIRSEVLKTYRIGEFPLEVFYECPVHSNILLVDGYCEECGKKWDVENFERNVLLRLIVQNEKNIDIHLYSTQTVKELKKVFPKVWLLYKDLETEEKLPSLKRKLSKTRQGDPFRVISSNHTY
jgi:hypothetical protein